MRKILIAGVVMLSVVNTAHAEWSYHVIADKVTDSQAYTATNSETAIDLYINCFPIPVQTMWVTIRFHQASLTSVYTANTSLPLVFKVDGQPAMVVNLKPPGKSGLREIIPTTEFIQYLEQAKGANLTVRLQTDDDLVDRIVSLRNFNQSVNKVKASCGWVGNSISTNSIKTYAEWNKVR